MRNAKIPSRFLLLAAEIMREDFVIFLNSIQRKVMIIFVACCFLGILPVFPVRAGQPSDEEITPALNSAEFLFKAMQKKQYADIWESLTAKTKRSIVSAVFKSSQKAGEEIARDKIVADFSAGGKLAQSYWDGYLFVFNPQMVLEQSKWTLGKFKDDKVEINILYKKSENPAILQLFKENNEWKVGLSETFGGRAMLPAF